MLPEKLTHPGRKPTHVSIARRAPGPGDLRPAAPGAARARAGGMFDFDERPAAANDVWIGGEASARGERRPPPPRAGESQAQEPAPVEAIREAFSGWAEDDVASLDPVVSLAGLTPGPGAADELDRRALEKKRAVEDKITSKAIVHDDQDEDEPETALAALTPGDQVEAALGKERIELSGAYMSSALDIEKRYRAQDREIDETEASATSLHDGTRIARSAEVDEVMRGHDRDHTAAVRKAQIAESGASRSVHANVNADADRVRTATEAAENDLKVDATKAWHEVYEKAEAKASALRATAPSVKVIELAADQEAAAVEDPLARETVRDRARKNG